MKTLKIYSVIATIAIIVLSIILYQKIKKHDKTQEVYKETEEVPHQCSDR
ncbi:hypothetical protein [Chryseobacterium sp. Leaf394]|nr:hypothetical protein [Chryseobacterium sp. Leaf394]